MRTYHDCNTDMRFKQVNSVKKIKNRLVGCSASLQPEYFAVSILEDHFYIK